ncbi:sensor histidine kinase [Hydrogenimonas thermophila]|uniref:histidine kinase n=1 Tax=Hydrogenimonas thermophila TaxID=223786 RepID=A0A1I5R6Y2_9BACT|nr:ATP-binding protein [Hydrogenimonas thermophila]WOE70700.1 ATP-binding protein [Hydrogenimonas thermophila]WOE73218.1 ATP-binding protein [Hydrogenimonas thermophila]SFP54279.1 His Kinase A (phospho-acceptor) domain-containing protein [Hydrogenimonas thermophila]
MKSKIAFKFAITTMIVATFGVGILAWLSYKQAKELFIQQTEQTIINISQNYYEKVSKSVGMLKYDLTMLRLSNAVQGMMRAYSDPFGYDAKNNKTFFQYKREVGNLFEVMAQQNDPYFQIRLIDAKKGQELLRVENNEGNVYILPEAQLQNKWHRDYVRESLDLKDGEVYLSKISLNREYRTIELPYKPTIRATTLLRYGGEKRAFIVINSNIKKLFGFDSFKLEKDITTYVTDDSGYYLYNPLYPEKEFGFEFGREQKIINDFPQLKPIYTNKVSNVSWYDSKTDSFYYAQRIKLSPERSIVVLKEGGSSIFKKRSSEYIAKLMWYVVIAVIFMTIFAALMVWKLTKPITKLTEVARAIAQSEGRSVLSINIHTNDEIEELAESLETMLKTLTESRREIEQFALKLENEVAKKTEDLQKLNSELEKKVQEGIEELRKKDETMLQQAKLAEMGEMIGAIAHQWRQPLNALALNIQMLEDMAADGDLNEKSIEEFIERNMKTIQFMSKTIDDFRNFYREEKEKRNFNLKSAIEETISLQKAQLEARKIEIETILEDIEIKGYKNDLMQVLLNLISNARDAIMEKCKKVQNFSGKITVIAKKQDNEIVILVSDNAGGIPENILHRVFDPYFTTKEEGKGTGLGLHMARRIIEEKMGGTLSAYNDKNGAVFEIRIKGVNEG